MRNIKIGEANVGADHPTYIIAELSANHVQDFDLAVKTIEAASKTGVDAIKLQTYRPDTITLDSDLPHFRTRDDTIWAGQKLHSLYEKAYMPWEWQPKLIVIAKDLGLDCFSSPFDASAVDFLDKLEVPAFKIASLEITDIPLIRLVASKGKPVIISTGAAEPADIKLAVDTCIEEGNNQIALLKCTSAYPTPLEEMNLLAIQRLQSEYNTVVGLSDHSLDRIVPVAAVTIGARIIEKHIILDRSINSVDGAFSLTPEEFKVLVDDVRKTELSLGTSDLAGSDAVKRAQASRRSLFAVVDIPKGTKITNEIVRSLRPGLGLHPRHLAKVLSMEASQDIYRGQPINWDLLCK